LSEKVVGVAARLGAQFGLRPRVLLLLGGSMDLLDELRMPGDTRALDEVVAGLLAT
jgi:hypothetical protein